MAAAALAASLATGTACSPSIASYYGAPLPGDLDAGGNSARGDSGGNPQDASSAIDAGAPDASSPNGVPEDSATPD